MPGHSPADGGRDRRQRAGVGRRADRRFAGSDAACAMPELRRARRQGGRVRARERPASGRVRGALPALLGRRGSTQGRGLPGLIPCLRDDPVVIGSGPAGQKAAIAKLGRTVAVARSRDAGGGCIHASTIPSKTLREVVSYLSGVAATDLRGRLPREEAHPHPRPQVPDQRVLQAEVNVVRGHGHTMLPRAPGGRHVLQGRTRSPLRRGSIFCSARRRCTPLAPRRGPSNARWTTSSQSARSTRLATRRRDRI
jgi:hypothetical protein